jgi:hypothetical protein
VVVFCVFLAGGGGGGGAPRVRGSCSLIY